jgi:Peptidyl-prolyl cis-trans isomerase (rotamase) - cyclophilin family
MTLTALAVVGALFAADKPDFSKETLPSPREATGKSINGKSLSDMLAKVKEIWPTIVFEKDGKKVEYVAVLDTDDGVIEVEFFPAHAPKHARSFIALTKAGYFDGTIFHRALPGFMIQGGCPLGNGRGGPGYALPAEFNSIKHEKGILSAARSNDPDSAGSQFFLCHDTASFLDGKYTVFGHVTKGMDVIDKIVNRPRHRNESGEPSAPDEPCKVKKATVKIKGEAAEKKSDADEKKTESEKKG